MRSNPGAAVRPSGLLAPRMLWPLDCFVARAPRNDGWVAADPIASVVIGRRLTPSFCAISSCSYPVTTNSNTVSRRAALAGRCFCAWARRRPRSGWESSRYFACGHASAPATRGQGGPIRRPYHRFPFPERNIATNSCTVGSYRPAAGETRCVQFTEPSRYGRACPGRLRRPIAPRSPTLSAPCRLSTWAACRPNHVDGRDKPGHDGKWHGKQDLTSLFLVSAATRLPQRSECDLRHIGPAEADLQHILWAPAPLFRALLAPRSYPPLRGALFVPWSCRSNGYPHS